MALLAAYGSESVKRLNASNLRCRDDKRNDYLKQLEYPSDFMWHHKSVIGFIGDLCGKVVWASAFVLLALVVRISATTSRSQILFL